MNDIKDFAMRMINSNPQIANNPNAQHLLRVIQSGNTEEGQKIAENLCKSMGVSKEDALKQARNYFHI